MKLVRLLVVCLCCVLAHAAWAQPVPIAASSPGATTYSFFVIQTKKLRDISLAQATANLAAAVEPYGITPCVVNSDLNATIACGTPSTATFMLPVPNEFFTYNGEWNLQKLPPIQDRRVFNKDHAYNQVWAVNFLSPQGSTPGDSAGRVPVHVQFAQPVTEFTFLVDSANPTAPASDAIQLEVNGVLLAPQTVVPGTPTTIGVEDLQGFSEVTIYARGGMTQAFLADRFSFLPQQP